MALNARNPSLRLRQAVKDNNVDLVMRLRYKTDLRNTDEDRLTSLAWAALSVSEDVFEFLLLDAGHDEDELSRDSANSTILHQLASLPSDDAPPIKGKKKKEIFEAAVRMTNMYWDFFPDLIDWSNAAGKTPLHKACESGNAEMVGTLCELGADVHLMDQQGNTPLHYASAWNNLGCIKVLLDYGAPSSSRNNEAFTALDYAFSTSLGKEFALAIRETNDARKNRRAAQTDAGGGRGLGPKASFNTVLSDEAAMRPGSAGPSTPPNFLLHTPEPKSPASTWSFNSDNPHSTNASLGFARANQHPSTPRKVNSPPSSPHPSRNLAPSPNQLQPPTPSSSSLSNVRNFFHRSNSIESSPSAGKRRAGTGDSGGTSPLSSNAPTRPVVPALRIPGSGGSTPSYSPELRQGENEIMLDSPLPMTGTIPPPQPVRTPVLGRPI